MKQDERSVVEKSILEIKKYLVSRKINVSDWEIASLKATLGCPFSVLIYYKIGTLCIHLRGDGIEGMNIVSLRLRRAVLRKAGFNFWSACPHEISSGKYVEGVNLMQAIEQAADALEKINKFWPSIHQVEGEYSPMIDALLEEAHEKVFGPAS